MDKWKRHAVKTCIFVFVPAFGGSSCDLCARINPQNEAAKKGLERLEKQMKVCILASLKSI